MDFDSYCEWAVLLAEKYGIPQPEDTHDDNAAD